MSSEVTNLTLTFPKDQMDQYSEIALSLDVDSKEEAFRTALLLLALLHEEAKKGTGFQLKQLDGSVETLKLFPKIAG